jgi:NADPH:quinone reductase-like Zn-dependent oxidoreductase
MQAWAHTARGKPRDVLRLQTIPAPRAPREGEVLIRVSHTTLTPAFSDLMAVIPAFVRRGRPAVYACESQCVT